MGTSETLGRGAIQFMTAGTGVRHSERNLSPDKPLHFIQMWCACDNCLRVHTCLAAACC